MVTSTVQTKPGSSTVKYCFASACRKGWSGPVRISPRWSRRTVRARGCPTTPDASSQRRTGGGSGARSAALTTDGGPAEARARSARACSSFA